MALVPTVYRRLATCYDETAREVILRFFELRAFGEQATGSHLLIAHARHEHAESLENFKLSLRRDGHIS